MEKPNIKPGQVFAHVPYHQLDRRLDQLLAQGIQPEIYFSAADLDRLDRREAGAAGERLGAAGLSCTFHAPFLDLNPGALDGGVRRLTASRWRAVLELAPLFNPRTIVFHPGYDGWRYDWQPRRWLKESLKTFGEVLDAALCLAPGAQPLVENIFEIEPSTLVELFSRLEGSGAGFCFDTGHFFLFARTDLDIWLESLGHLLAEVHLHDNRGERDEHLPPGRGGFPFDRLFAYLKRAGKMEICFTLEAHSEEDLRLSLDYMNNHFSIK